MIFLFQQAVEASGESEFVFPGERSPSHIASRSVSKAMERTRDKLGIKCGARTQRHAVRVAVLGTAPRDGQDRQCRLEIEFRFLAAAISVRLSPVSSAKRTIVAMVGDMAASPSSIADQSRRMSSGLEITSRG